MRESPPAEPVIHSHNIVACIWDFDKTLIPGYMQAPIFEEYQVDARQFWDEVQELPRIYASRGTRVSEDTIYLNHLLSYVRNGPLRGLSNARLRELGGRLRFYPGLPTFFEELRQIAQRPQYRSHDISIEHYIVSNGIAEMIRGSAIAPHVEGIYGCEFVENPMPPGFNRQSELLISTEGEISQIGLIVDNTIKTRFLFEINKGTNKNPAVGVNASVRAEDRRVPMRNMIYIADGPSDVPSFAVITRNGGKAFAVHTPQHPEEFAQNDLLLEQGRIHAYGPADYRTGSHTAMWLGMHVEHLCERIVRERDAALAERVTQPPRHFHDKTHLRPTGPTQTHLL